MDTTGSITRRSMLALSAAGVTALGVESCVAQENPKPGTDAEPAKPPNRRIIDMHAHAFSVKKFGEIPPEPPVVPKLRVPRDDQQLMELSLAELKKYNIVKAVVSGPKETVFRWREAAPGRLIGAAFLDQKIGLPDPGELRADFLAGRIRVLGELGPQYAGLSPADPKLEPYYALAEDFDIPVGVHCYGLGPMAVVRGLKWRLSLTKPLQMEEVLVRHPKLRVYLMHAGMPWFEETVALMRCYPQVYADLALINWIVPREAFHHYLRGLMRYDLGKRLMFGSDQVIWPEVFGRAVEGIESAAFLSDEQKQDVFYNNAARFLKLDEKGNLPDIRPGSKPPK